MNIAYLTQNISEKVVILLVEFYRMSRRRVCRILERSLWKQRCREAKHSCVCN